MGQDLDRWQREAPSALLACLGLFELRGRRVSSGIIVPAIVEAVLAAGFVWTHDGR